jgi:hypothetical protein
MGKVVNVHGSAHGSTGLNFRRALIRFMRSACAELRNVPYTSNICGMCTGLLRIIATRDVASNVSTETRARAPAPHC